MGLIDFTFQSGEFAEASSGFVETFLGTLVGIGTPLAVFYLETKRDKKKTESEKTVKEDEERKARDRRELDTLNYFAAGVEHAISYAEKQGQYYIEHANDLRTNPLENNLSRTIITLDLERSVNRFDHERIFHAYLSQFGNSLDQIKIFRSIYGKLDFLHAYRAEIISVQEHYLKNLHKRILKYKELVEEQIDAHCSVLANHIEHNDPHYSTNQFFISLNECLLNFHRSEKPKNDQQGGLYHIQGSLVEPLKSKLAERHLNIPAAVAILENCRRATWLLNETIAEVNSTADNFEEFGKELIKISGALKERAANLLSLLQ